MHEELEVLRRFLRDEAVDLKRQDATVLVRTVSARLAGREDWPARPAPRAVQTAHFWWHRREYLGRRIDGAVASWALAGALAGATIALVFGGTALVAHGLHLPQWLATAIGTVLVALQTAAVAGALPAGPFDTIGGIVLWPDEFSAVDIVAPLIALAVAVAGFTLLGRFSLDGILPPNHGQL